MAKTKNESGNFNWQDGGFKIVDSNGQALAYVYGLPLKPTQYQGVAF